MRLERINKENLSGGVQCRTTRAMANDNQVLHCLNGVFDVKIGGVVGRKGSLRKSQVVAGEIIENLFVYKNDTTIKYLTVSDDHQASENKDIYVNAAESFAGAWSKAREDLTVAAQVGFRNFATKVAIFDGVNAPQFWNGASFTAITNAPTAGLYPEVYEQKLYVLDKKGFLHYSDVINANGDGLTSTTWTNRGIHPNDGQDAKMLIRHRGVLRIIKEESIYTYDGSNEPEAPITIGTHSSKSVVATDEELFFHNPIGIFMMTTGKPVLISRGVRKYLNGMDPANWDNVSSGRDVYGNIYFWIGDVSITDGLEHDCGETYSDVVLVFNVYSQNWTVFTDWNARAWFYDEIDGSTYFGTADGKIFKINVEYADVDDTTITAINFDLIFTPYDFGYPERVKTVGKIVLAGEHQLKMKAGNGFAKMEDMGITNKIVDGQPVKLYGRSNREVTAEELWIGASQAYKDFPPYVKGLIIDKINLAES